MSDSSAASVFSVVKTVKPEGLHFEVSGYVNENAGFPSMADATPEMVVSLQAVTGLSSIGTRAWCDWVATFPPTSTVYLENCPVIFVKGFNRVVGVLTPKTKVRSFYVPFFSEKHGRKDALFGVDLATGKISATKVVDADGVTMEMDVLPDYFNFLKK